MKKVLSMLAAMTMIVSMTSCAKGDEESSSGSSNSNGKEVLNVWAFTDEVPGMVDKYISLNPEFGEKYEIKTTIIPTTDGNYQPALDQALAAGGKDAPDLYAAEAAFVLKYTQGEAAKYAAPYKDLGIDVDKAIADAGIAQYSVDIGTNTSGDVVGLGYQATGGAFIYRRSIAKDVFGTDDPAVIKSEIGPGWDKFFEAADELKAKNYGIVSGDGDMWHAVENSSDSGWVVDGKLHIDPKREEFLDFSKKLMDNEYHNNTEDWSDAWFADMKGDFNLYSITRFIIDDSCNAQGCWGNVASRYSRFSSCTCCSIISNLW